MAIRSQADQRQSFNKPDQWGRSWLISIEKATGDPTGQILPAGWSDPINTPQKYLRVPRHQATMSVEYEPWIADMKAADRDYRQQLNVIGHRLYGEKFDARKKPTQHMLDYAGPPPVDWREIERAANGDRELLGLKEPVTVED